MTDSKNILPNLSKLAKLHILPEEQQFLAEDLNKILNMVAQIEEVETDNIQPLAHPLDITQNMRSDEIPNQHIKRKKLQQLVSEDKLYEHHYLVPCVIPAGKKT